MALWQQFTAGAPGGGSVAPAVSGALQSLVKRDEKTGEAYLKLPVPTTEVLDKALRAIEGCWKVCGNSLVRFRNVSEGQRREEGLTESAGRSE